jgi:hypothetical protein
MAWLSRAQVGIHSASKFDIHWSNLRLVFSQHRSHLYSLHGHTRFSLEFNSPLLLSIKVSNPLFLSGIQCPPSTLLTRPSCVLPSSKPSPNRMKSPKRTPKNTFLFMTNLIRNQQLANKQRDGLRNERTQSFQPNYISYFLTIFFQSLPHLSSTPYMPLLF